MTIERWNPGESISRQEQFILKRLKRNGKLYGCLRLQRHRLFDEAPGQAIVGRWPRSNTVSMTTYLMRFCGK